MSWKKEEKVLVSRENYKHQVLLKNCLVLASSKHQGVLSQAIYSLNQETR